ncbi:MAG: hypothetical protein RLZZ09_1232 [Pseudomonadota bacterium]|jgi:tetratricopeptide (TPR) repeat protein
MTLQELQPYFSAISAALSVATLGLILNIVKTIRDAAQDQIAAKEERLKGVVDDHTRLKDWSEREKADLRTKLEEAKAQVDELLKQEGINPSALAAGKRISDSTVELQTTVQRLTAEMQQTILKLTELGGHAVGANTANATRTIAMAEMASGRYNDAAHQYDAFAASGSASWEDHLSRGVAHANARHGRNSDIAALLAYNDAIALAPDDLGQNWRARLLTYRAAMLKRLGRFDEAESDLALSIRLATESYESLDAHYNLACVYAMQRRGEEMYRQLDELQGSRRFLAGVAAHLHDYFAYFKTDERLQSLLALRASDDA